MLCVCQIVGFSWENCGKADDPAVMKNLDLSPDPINIPGDLTASAAGTTSVTLGSPLSVSTVHWLALKPRAKAEVFLQDVILISAISCYISDSHVDPVQNGGIIWAQV